MGAGMGPDFGNTQGSLSERQKVSPFSKDGKLTLESVKKNRDAFIGKSINDIQKLMSDVGYQSIIKKSNRATSRAELIVVTNNDATRNVNQVQVSPGSRRHGDVPYVKISTTDIGKIKIVDSSPKEYKTDGHEKSTIIYGR